MREPEFDGESYETERDFDRLHSQYQRVWNVMKDSKWRTLYQIHVAINGLGTEAAISARLRDFRKEKFGNHTVNRRYLHDGLFEIVIVRKLNFWSVLKTFLHFKRLNPKKVELLQAKSAIIKTTKKIHFQVDGEYLGKVDEVKADILPSSLNLLLPVKNK